MTWSINWDASDNWNFANKIGAYLAKLNVDSSIIPGNPGNNNGNTGNPGNSGNDDTGIDDIPSWAAGVSYGMGDVIVYQGVVYTCTFSHTSIVSWEPGPGTAAL